jgi:AcrR family transcriptional regulator
VGEHGIELLAAEPLRRGIEMPGAQASTFRDSGSQIGLCAAKDTLAAALCDCDHGRGKFMASNRRMGPENSASREALMDGVETVMIEQGYASLTARNVAHCMGLKHQLVYYYFHTMEDLLLAAYRRRTGQVMARIEQALASEEPLQALWEVYSDPVQAALTVEYMALANHNETVRVETVEFGESMRRTGLDRIADKLGVPPGGAEALSPFALSMAILSIGSILGMESALGISGGHKETRELVQWGLDQLRPKPAEGG